MPRFTRTVNGAELVIETAIPREAAELRAQGFTEHKARTAAVRQADQGPAPVPADSGNAPAAASTKATK